MLPSKNRLHKNKEIKRVLRGGKSFFTLPLRLKFVKNQLSFSRFAIIISNKVSKKATQRNRLKRQISEIIRLNLEKIRPGFDFVFIINPKILELKPIQLKDMVLKTLNKLKLEI